LLSFRNIFEYDNGTNDLTVANNGGAHIFYWEAAAIFTPKNLVINMPAYSILDGFIDRAVTARVRRPIGFCMMMKVMNNFA